MFNNHDNCSAEWCFKTRASEEGNAYNNKDDEISLQTKRQPYIQTSETYSFPVSNIQLLKESLHIIYTQKNELMNNVITYVAPKIKTMAHSMSLNNRISCVVVISIFGFNTYCKLVFNLMEIKTTPTFKQFLQSKTINTDKNKSYYQWYDVKLLKAFHKQAMIKQWIYDKILARRSGMGYSPGIKFQTSLINMDGSKSPTMSNQPERNQQKQCRCGSIKNLRVTSKDCPVGLAIRKAKKLGLGYEAISIPSKEGSRIFSRRGRQKMSGGRGRWGGWKIRWGDISRKCGIKYGCWVRWGN